MTTMADRDKEPVTSRSIAPMVADHYNKLKEVGREAREQSRIIHLRNFNNWIKSMLIGEALSKLREEDYHRQITVLDVACGKGGDLRKWKFGRVHHLIMSDIAETSLDQARDRYNELLEFENRRGGGDRRWSGRSNSRLFTAEFIAADATRDRIKDKLSYNHRQVDLTSIQFSFHYCFESYEQVHAMLRNLGENLKPGGYLIGSTPDAFDIVRRAREAESTTFGNEIFNITFDSEDILDESKQVPLFGAKYHFTLEGVVNCPEFLVYFPALEQMALEHDLELVFKERFDKYYERMRNTDEGLDTLRRMRVLETFPPRPGNEMSSTVPGDYEHAEEWLRPGRSVQTLSKSEWEAITLYLVFVFRKRAPGNKRLRTD